MNQLRTSSERTNSERTPNKLRTNSERTLNELRTNSERTPNELRTNSERTPNELRANSERTPDKLRTNSEQTPNELRANSEQTPNKRTSSERTLAVFPSQLRTHFGHKYVFEPRYFGGQAVFLFYFFGLTKRGQVITGASFNKWPGKVFF